MVLALWIADFLLAQVTPPPNDVVNGANDNGPVLVMLWLTIVIYNVSIILILRTALAGFDWNKAATDNKMLAMALQMSQGGTNGNGGTTPAAPSVSRGILILGGVILACFFWAIGNVTLYLLFTKQTDVPVMVKNVWPLLVAGAAMFLPYAANVLSKAPGQNHFTFETREDGSRVVRADISR